MLRGIEKLVTYVVLFVVFIFGIVFLAKQIGLTADLKQSLVQATHAGVNSGDLDKITHLHNSSSKVFFLSFFALCLLLIGIIMVIRGIERAYDISEVKEKVRYHLKSTTPGVVMIVLASFLMAFCAYRTSYLETVYSSRLINYNNYKIAAQGWKKPEVAATAVRIDSSVLPRLKRTAKKVVDVPDLQKKTAAKFDKQQAPKLVAPARPAMIPEKKEQPKPVAVVQKKVVPATPSKPLPAPKPAPVAVQKQSVPPTKPIVVVRKAVPAAPRQAPVTVAAKKEPQHPKLTARVIVRKKETPAAPVVVQKKEAAPQKKATVVAVKTQKSAPAKVVAAKKAEPAPVARRKSQAAVVSDMPKREEAHDDRPVTQADIEWANRFQRNVTIYGYNPSKREEARYSKVRNYYEKHDGNIMNDDLKWAYSFLEKTKKGYEPKPGELEQYENVIQRNIRNNDQSSRQREF